MVSVGVEAQGRLVISVVDGNQFNLEITDVVFQGDFKTRRGAGKR